MDRLDGSMESPSFIGPQTSKRWVPILNPFLRTWSCSRQCVTGSGKRHSLSQSRETQHDLSTPLPMAGNDQAVRAWKAVVAPARGCRVFRRAYHDAALHMRLDVYGNGADPHRVRL